MLAGDVFIAHVCWLLPTYVYFCPLAIHSRRNMFCEVPKAKIFLVFSIQNSILFLEAEKLCGSVELGLSPDAPLLVKYDLETADKGHMKFYLAPKIDEWWARFDSEAVLWHVWCCCLVQRFNTQCRVCFERRSAMYYGGKHCWGRSVPLGKWQPSTFELAVFFCKVLREDTGHEVVPCKSMVSQPMHWIDFLILLVQAVLTS